VTRRGRGRPVAGVSARKARKARRSARGEADRLRRGGLTAPPAGDVVAADDLAELARRHRQQREAPGD
jgi:hypothetical protein